MSGNGRGNMRPTSRSPPFLVVGLLIAACILAFNYWTVSSKNKDLSKQLETLQFDFRSVSDKHLAVEKRASDLSSQAADYQSKVAILQNSASEKDTKVTWLTDEISKLNSQLENVQRQKQQIEDEKKSVLEDLGSTRKELEDERNKVVVCDKGMCREVVRQVMKVMLDRVGKSAVVSAFSPTHPDVLSMVNDLVQGATDPPVPQAQGNPQPYPQGAAQQQQQQQAGGGLNKFPIQEQELGQNSNMGQDPNLGQNPAQNLNVGQIPNMPPQNGNQGPTSDAAAQNPDAAAQNPNLGQSLTFGQNPDMGENPNVVQMQQGQPAQQADTQGQMTAGGQEGGKYSPQQQPQQDLGLLGQPSQQKPDLNLALQANAPPQGQEEQGTEPKDDEEDKAGEQEIVAQNIPQGNGGEEAVMTNNEDDDHHHLDGQLQDLNAAPAQEDVGDDAHPDLPEDEMDKQAAANHEQGDLGNLDENFHDQLHELSRNDINNPERDLDKVDMDDDEHDRAFRVGVDDNQERVERKEEDRDFDEHDMEGPLH